MSALPLHPPASDLEQRLIEFASGELDVLWKTRRAKSASFEDIPACVVSDSGGLYAGTPFKRQARTAGFCAERHAMADMAYREGPTTRVAAVVVAGPVPSPPAPVTMPCGICRAVLHELALPGAAVLCSSYLLREEGITPFPQIELYPHPWEPIIWDEWFGK